MAQPIWITPAGSLGVIPEAVFFSQPLLAQVQPAEIPANCVGTSSINNRITCDTTAGAAVGNQVKFFGETFGGIEENLRYYVFAIYNNTQFAVATSLTATDPLILTTASGTMTARFYQPVLYRLQSGTLPTGMQLATAGVLNGVPQATQNIQGVPIEVSRDVTSKFTVRAYTQQTVNNVTTLTGFADRTFTLTITGDDIPQFITPAGNIGTFYDGDEVDLEIDYTNTDPDDRVVVRLVQGQLPLGLRLTPEGRIFGYIKPFPNVNEPPGYDLTPSAVFPYDFISSSISKNYQFVLEISDGKSNNIRSFEIFVYNREDLTADYTLITADNATVTADETTERQPFLVNAEPSDLGIIRGDNYFAYRFIGQDYDTELLEYVITVNQGFGLPPGLQLDPYTGWYYGFIPDVLITEITYSFNIQVRARSLVCTNTTAGTNRITTASGATTRGDFYVGALVRFEGEVFGGIATNTVYYVTNIISDTEFQVALDPLDPPVVLTTASGSMLCVPDEISASRPYPFTLTVTGSVDREVTWLTDANLGLIDNGSTSVFQLAAVNRGGQLLQYQLANGAFNELPQGLALLPTGAISGRVTFNTFAIDLGDTTFDETQSQALGLDPTTFDQTFRFTANAFAEDPSQPLFKVSIVRILSGGTGFVNAPTLTFNTPIGSTGVQAQATAIVLGGSIVSVVVTNSGADYTDVAEITVSGPGSGAVLEVVMQPTGVRRVVSSNQEFTIKVLREYNKPYQNLYVVAMPPEEDRILLEQLLGDPEIFVPEYIYRLEDPYFGINTRVTYLHAVGLEPDVLETYVESLYLNHYWKQLTLGQVRTAQALDSQGNVIYEVVYSQIIDNLVNDQGASVSKIETLPYAIPDPADSSLITSVYPNSLINMRTQVIDVVGQISTKLPLWMTSKQENGSVLGFTPAWVLCYAKPGRGDQIAYYLNRYFGERLNQIDFVVDRYILDAAMSRNWDTATQDWTPQPNLTTFDRILTTGYTNLGSVNACTELAFSQVNRRKIDEINALGGLDGPTWISIPGQTPPLGTQVIIRDGSRIIFVKQELFLNQTVDQAFTNAIGLYDSTGFDQGDVIGVVGSYDYGRIIPGGIISTCTTTTAGNDSISCSTTLGMIPGTKVWFTGSVFGGVDDQGSGGTTQLYYVRQVLSITATQTLAASDEIVVSSTADIENGDQIWFSGTALGSISTFEPDGDIKPYYVINKSTSPARFQISETPNGAAVSLLNDSGSMTVNLPIFQISASASLDPVFPLSNGSGSMFANYNYLRLAIYEITIDVNDIITLSLDQETIANDFVASTQGQKYDNGTLLYHTPQPELGQTRVSWAPLITAVPVIVGQTTFDKGSVQWVEPVDMYNPTDDNDKYLVFPKKNILV